MSDLKSLIAKVAGGQSLSVAEAADAFNVIMSGEATPVQIGAFLTGLRLRGETVDEIAGAVATMRAKSGVATPCFPANARIGPYIASASVLRLRTARSRQTPLWVF